MMSIKEKEGVDSIERKTIIQSNREDKLTMSDEEEERRPPNVDKGDDSDDEEGWRCVML